MGEYDYAKDLYYGLPGSGKTRLAYSAACVPTTSPVLGLNIHGNPISTRDYPQDQIMIVNLERLPIDDIERVLAAIYDFLETGKENVTTKKYNLRRPKVVVFDSLTDLNRRAAFKLSNIDDLPFGKIPSGEVNAIKDYNLLHSYLHEFAAALYSLPIHTIITTLEANEEKGKLENRAETGIVLPALTGRASRELMAYPYFVGRMTVWQRLDENIRSGILASGLMTTEGEFIDSKSKNVASVQRVLQIRPSLKVPICKNQYTGDSTSYIANPDFETLLKFRNLA